MSDALRVNERILSFIIALGNEEAKLVLIKWTFSITCLIVIERLL